jgi:DNA invertase Pin-like site-specific DNA recombinase
MTQGIPSIQASKARGRVGGRPKALDENKVQIARSLYADGKTSVAEICETLKVSKATLYRNLKLAKAACGPSMRKEASYAPVWTSETAWRTPSGRRDC